jgi:putative cell wall-binding protein
MTLLPSTTRRRRTCGVAVALVATVALTTVGAQTASAVDDAPPIPFCPPTVQTVGTHLSEPLWDVDVDAGSYFPSIRAGDLPVGASLYDGVWHADYQAVPMTAGSYDFTIRLTSGLGTTADAACHVDVYDDELNLAGRLITSRIAAPDRYEEAVAISGVLAAVADTVFIASGEVFADALSASAIAAQTGSPLLLTKATSIPASVKNELARLNPQRIVILGGPATVDDTVETSLQAFAPVVERYAGADRFEASRNVIVGEAPTSSKIYIASGNVFPDALSAAPAGGITKAPVLLVNGMGTELTTAETDLLDARDVTRATIVGGSSTVSAELENSLLNEVPQVKRISGTDRYDASAAVARDTIPSSSTTKPDTVYLATGERFPDALSGAVLAAKTGSPIYLVHSDCIPRDAARHILDIGATKAVLLGGRESLTEDVMSLKICSK